MALSQTWLPWKIPSYVTIGDYYNMGTRDDFQWTEDKGSKPRALLLDGFLHGSEYFLYFLN